MGWIVNKKKENRPGGCIFSSMAIVGLVIVLMVGGCSYINKKLKLRDDNFGEEIIEGVIESQLGVDVDLTPESPE